MSKVAVELGSGEKIPVIDFAGLTSGDLAIRKTTAMSMREAFEDLAAQRPRYSATLFYEPRHEVVISCLEPCQGPTRPALYSPITAGEHLAARRRETIRSGYEN